MRPKTFLTFIVLLCMFSVSYGQSEIGGIVLDVESKQRIAKVFLVNKSTGEKIYNNSKGEFAMKLREGDLLIASKENYFSDTLVYKGEKVLVISLKRKAIEIPTVNVVARRSPEEILEQRKKEYSRAYRLADPGDYVSVGQNGAGLSIDAVYNYFSREGRNARRLTQYFQKEYEDNYIDMVFSRELVKRETGLEGEALDNFMVRYRPTYAFVLKATHYDLVKYIKTKYQYFKYIPYIKPLPDLQKIDLSLEK
ncbi:hypothetical protein [Sphingobacterium thermophilum]|uniref:hypothetical protein n=1 Tax=Sphingobacterium thermophilum TaxID=768534 RepID=UPI0031F0B1D7